MSGSLGAGDPLKQLRGDMTHRYRSKIDAWLVIVFLAPSVLLLALMPVSTAGSAILIVALTDLLILAL